MDDIQLNKNKQKALDDLSDLESIESLFTGSTILKSEDTFLRWEDKLNIT